MQPVVDVAAAIIERPDGTFLLSQRPTGKIYEGYWEFPGGKVEPGEPTSGALARELREELGIEVELAYPWITSFYVYEHAVVKLHFYRVIRWRGDPSSKEEQILSWQSGPNLTVGPMLPKSVAILKPCHLPLLFVITNPGKGAIGPAITSVRRA